MVLLELEALNFDCISGHLRVDLKMHSGEKSYKFMHPMQLCIQRWWSKKEGDNNGLAEAGGDQILF